MPGSLLSTATSKRRKSAVCLKREETNACMRRGEEEEEEVTDKSGPRWAGWFVRGTSAKSGVTTLRRISAPQTPNLSDPDYLPHSVAPSPRLASVSPRQSAGSSPYRCYCLEKSELLLFFFFLFLWISVEVSNSLLWVDKNSLISFAYGVISNSKYICLKMRRVP